MMTKKDYFDKEHYQQFLETYYKDQILQLCNLYPKQRSLLISFLDLHNFDSELADNLLLKPRIVLNHMEQALQELDWLPLNVHLSDTHIRIMNLFTTIPIRDLRSNQLGHFIAIEGMVRKTTEVYPQIKTAVYECISCGQLHSIPQSGMKLQPPQTNCTNELCRKKDFRILTNESVFEDIQRILVQEPPENVRGTNPQNLEIIASDDLAGQISPGDRVVICGMLDAIQKQDGKYRNYSLILYGNSIQKIDKEFDELGLTSEDEQQILELSKDPNLYQRMVYSIAPSVYGTTILNSVKQAILLQLFSGVRKKLPDGSLIRGDIHILLVGDPGVAKSQLLRYVVNLSPRGVLASGKGTTASGLTATAVKDEMGDGRWSIEGGALVMANGGIAAIDEMDKMKVEDRSALHEAMEQQMISIAKAGIIATLKTQCSILGASNPRSGRFDIYESISEQINMPPSLLSRFDLIYILTDNPNEEVDKKISEHILRNHYLGELLTNELEINEKELHDFIPISSSLLQKYIAYARLHFHPILSTEAKEHLQKFYTMVRKVGSKTSTISLTARQLEALIRIAEASAKLRLSNTVSLDDAKLATSLTSDCMKQIGIDPETGNLDIDYIESGTRRSRKEKINILRRILKRMNVVSGGEEVLLQSVIDECMKSGITEEDAKILMDHFHTEGGYVERGLGYIKINEHVLEFIL